MSRQSKVRIVFATDVASSDLIGKPANELLGIAPRIDGSAAFTGPRELVLTPDKPLRRGAWYRVTVKAWHLDDQYLGSTTAFHQQALDMSPGVHVITVVDQDGNRLARQFEVLAKAADQRG